MSVASVNLITDPMNCAVNWKHGHNLQAPC